MMALLFAPLLIPVAFRLIITFLVPLIETHTTFVFKNYQHYLLTFVLLLSPMMLSIVIGFSMIDDRDNKIVELISVTPMSKSGYLFMRLGLVFAFVIFYSAYSYAVLGIYILQIITLLYLALLMCLYSGVMGLLLFSVATDKVNGLTYAKGLNAVALFAFVDLLDLKWLNILAGFFPPYWVTQIADNPQNILALTMCAVTSIVWFVLFLAKTKI